MDEIRAGGDALTAAMLARKILEVFPFDAYAGARAAFESKMAALGSEDATNRLVRECTLPAAIVCLAGKFPPQRIDNADDAAMHRRIQHLFDQTIVELTLQFNVGVLRTKEKGERGVFLNGLVRHVHKALLLHASEIF